MNLLIYSALAIAFVTGLVFLSTYFENRRHKKRVKLITQRSDRSQEFIDAQHMHLAKSAVQSGYNKDVVAEYVDAHPGIKNDNAIELWRINPKLKRMPPLYLFQQLIPLPVKSK